MTNTSSFLNSLVEINCIKFGNFTLKSGVQSPIYIDLRELVSYPKLLKQLAELFQKKIPDSVQIICGVPYAALPMATAVSLQTNISMIIKRKVVKTYGAKKLIEGSFKKGDKILLIEDVVTSGISLEETIIELEAEGLIIEKILIVLDREQGGIEKLMHKGYDVEALYSLSSVISLLFVEHKIDEKCFNEVNEFLSNSRIGINEKPLQIKPFPKNHPHKKAQQLLDIANEKKSNIIASVDLTTSNEILFFLNKVGKDICAAKLHIDIVSDFSFEFITQLKLISKQYNFLLIEDRKFADIGNTQLLQLSKGIYKISSWADFVTIHLIAGEASLKAIEDWDEECKPALIPILEMSSKGSLTDENYINNCKLFLNKYSCVVGAVCKTISLDEYLLKFTPGIHLSSTSDNKGQQFNTPKFAIENLKSNFLIVGRGLYKTENPEISIQEYLAEIRNLIFLN